jgi:type IV pilus assembly protein PilE
MPCPNRHEKPAPRGFTLVEAMLVVALLAILVSLAMPSYRRYLMRAHRTAAIGQLMSIAACQERIRAATGAYDSGRCLPGDSEHYQFAYPETGQPPEIYIQVAARPRAGQSDDVCGELLLDSLGARAASGASRCWSGR